MSRHSIPIGISLPKKIMSQIDSERGDISRSRFLLRMIEGIIDAENLHRKSTDIRLNDSVDEVSESDKSSEPVSA